MKINKTDDNMPNNGVAPMPDDDLAYNDDMDDSDDDFEMDGNQMDDDMGNDDENPYDSDFDAGVEADEDEDPKKFIEQLSGKLSQSLNSYQKNLDKPDPEIAKYAAGMVVKAAIKDLSQNDIEDILSKLKKDENDFDGSDYSNDDEENDEDNDYELDSDTDSENDEMDESVKYNLDELFNDVLNTKNTDEKPLEQVKDISYKKKPFTSPKF